jgi:hypothetical protein
MDFDQESIRAKTSGRILTIGINPLSPTFSTQAHVRLFLICEKEKSESKQRSGFCKRL